MASIRTKLILYVNITIAIMDMISILLFFVYLKNNEQKSLEKLGISLVSLVSQDNEVRQALSYAQPALLAIPIQRMLSLDGSGEVAYWRMLHADGGLVEENVQGVHLDANEISIEKEGRQNSPFSLLVSLPVPGKILPLYCHHLRKHSFFRGGLRRTNVRWRGRYPAERRPYFRIRAGRLVHP